MVVAAASWDSGAFLVLATAEAEAGLDGYFEAVVADADGGGAALVAADAIFGIDAWKASCFA